MTFRPVDGIRLFGTALNEGEKIFVEYPDGTQTLETVHLMHTVPFVWKTFHGLKVSVPLSGLKARRP